MANNIPAFKAELLSLFGSTTNIDAATKTKLRNRFVTEFPSDWITFLNGRADTTALRGEFAIEQIAAFMSNIYRAGSSRENQVAMPAPEVLG